MIISLDLKRLKIDKCQVTRCALVVLAMMVATATVFGAKRYQPHIDPTNFQSIVDNPYFPLVPGTILKYVETEGGETSEIEVTVTSETKIIMGVKCMVVHYVLTTKRGVKEDTYDWYAQDKDGTVWYFGELTKEFKRGGRVGTEGSWEAGVRGAQPGIIMPGDPHPSKPYRQEYMPGKAEDMAQIIATNEAVTVPAGTFTTCVKTRDWSMLESGNEYKWYAKGVGVVRTQSSGGEVATLMSIKRP
jgi:hypothetical protein